MKKKLRLGRNLDVLLSGQSLETLVAETPEKETLRYLPIEYLQPGRYQPRRKFDQEALSELADSIRTQGIITPLIVRPLESNRYELIAGERRWRAAQLAKLSEVPVLIKALTDETALAIALIENIQRQDLNSIEEAEAIRRLIDEFNMTHQQVAETLGRSRTTITNLLRLLELEPSVKTLLFCGQIEMGHARALLSLEPLLQKQLAEKIVSDQLSVRATERWVHTYLQPTKKIARNPLDADVQQLQKTLSEKLGAKVIFQQQGPSKGKMVICYNNLDELEGILKHIQ